MSGRSAMTGYFVLCVTVVLVICFNSGQAQRQTCVEHAVAAVAGGVTQCARAYLRCEQGAWRRAMCVGGVINMNTGECTPYNEECPDSEAEARSYTSFRRKRQATQEPDCSRSFMCPNLQSIFIYPDWTNTACDGYVVCMEGQLLLASCRSFGYNYYNPRRLSCEEMQSQTNTCLFRMNTDLSPLFD